MTGAATLLLAALQMPIVQIAPAAGADEALAQARAALRRGLLSETKVALAALPATADAEHRAHAELLLGNVAYEQGRFDEALSRYQSATGLFQATVATGTVDLAEALRTSRNNEQLARTQLDRRVVLAGAVTELRAALAAALVAAAVVVVLVARRAGQRPRATG